VVRASAVLSDGAYMLNFDCDHYIYNCTAVREAMCNICWTAPRRPRLLHPVPVTLRPFQPLRQPQPQHRLLRRQHARARRRPPGPHVRRHRVPLPPVRLVRVRPAARRRVPRHLHGQTKVRVVPNTSHETRTPTQLFSGSASPNCSWTPSPCPSTRVARCWTSRRCRTVGPGRATVPARPAAGRGGGGGGGGCHRLPHV
jgi:hypothetical protein